MSESDFRSKGFALGYLAMKQVHGFVFGAIIKEKKRKRGWALLTYVVGLPSLVQDWDEEQVSHVWSWFEREMSNLTKETPADETTDFVRGAWYAFCEGGYSSLVLEAAGD